MRVAVYPGSFDPLHIGHLAVMKRLASCGLFDVSYVIVSPKSPFKQTDPGTGRSRYNAAVKAIAQHPELKATVDDIELGMQPPYYTIRTLDALKHREPENDFTLIIGGDQLTLLRDWKDWHRILSDYGVAVYPRSGACLEQLRDSLLPEGHGGFKIQLLDAPCVDVSSSEIRKGLSEGRDMSKWMM